MKRSLTLTLIRTLTVTLTLTLILTLLFIFSFAAAPTLLDFLAGGISVPAEWHRDFEHLFPNLMEVCVCVMWCSPDLMHCRVLWKA